MEKGGGFPPQILAHRKFSPYSTIFFFKKYEIWAKVPHFGETWGENSEHLYSIVGKLLQLYV